MNSTLHEILQKNMLNFCEKMLNYPPWNITKKIHYKYECVILFIIYLIQLLQCQGNLQEVSQRCRLMLQEAERLYRKGQYEDALVLFHKGHHLRPAEPAFRLGIAKTEDKLTVIFTGNNHKDRFYHWWLCIWLFDHNYSLFIISPNIGFCPFKVVFF